MLPGILVGYALRTGGGWTGDLLVASWEDMEHRSAADIHEKRSGSHHSSRKTRPTWWWSHEASRTRHPSNPPSPSTEHRHRSRGGQPPSRRRYPTNTSRCRARSNRGKIRFLEHGGRLHPPSSCCTSRSALYIAHESSFAIPLVHIDENRQTQPNLDKQEESSVDDCWHVDGNKTQSEDRIGLTRFQTLMQCPPKGTSG